MKIDFLENKQEREMVMRNNKESIQILDKVKTIFTLGQSGLMTMKMVEQYFDINESTLKMCISNNRAELEENGLKIFTRKEVHNVVESLKSNVVTLEKVNQYKDKLTFNGEEIIITNRGLLLINKRVLLNIAMLLRDSEIAKECRKRLLDIVYDSEENKGSMQTIVKEIDEEMKLKVEYVDAMMSGNINLMNEINAKLFELKNKRIADLETTLNDLVDSQTGYETLRRELVANVKGISKTIHNCNYSKTYKVLYKFLLDNGYNLELRRTNMLKRLQDKTDELYIEIKDIQALIQSHKEVCTQYKRNSEEYKKEREIIKQLETQLKDKQRDNRSILKDFNHYSKCSKLEFIKDKEYEDIITITRSWGLLNGYDWRDKLDTKDDDDIF